MSRRLQPYIKAGQLEFFHWESIPARSVPAFHRTRTCITMFRTARHFSLFSQSYILKTPSGIIPQRMPMSSKRSPSLGFPIQKTITPFSPPRCVPHRAPEIYFKITYETMVHVVISDGPELHILIHPYAVSNISADAATILKILA